MRRGGLESGVRRHVQPCLAPRAARHRTSWDHRPDPSCGPGRSAAPYDKEEPGEVSARMPLPPDATDVRHVFVYGTLMPGEQRWPALAAYAVGEPVACTTRGRLFDTGRGYPAMFDGDADVPGWLVRLADATLEEAVAALDGIEGTERGLYVRRRVTVDGHPAWVYLGGEERLRGEPIERWRACGATSTDG